MTTRDTSLAFRRLEIRRMPGFSRGGFTLDGLSPGINVIFGPNGSGKSTSARAMHALLWPQQARDDVELFSSVSLGDQPWTVALEFGRSEWQRGGVIASPPRLPSADGKDRYMLDLVQLLVAEDQNFASAIARESLGGYDIDEAADAAGFSRQIEGKRTLPMALRDAKKALEEAQKEEDALLEEERSLYALRIEKQRAEQAAFEEKTAAYLVEVLRTRTDEQAALDLVQSFPKWMDKLNGNENELLDDFERQTKDADQAMSDAERLKETAIVEMDRTGLGTDGLSRVWINRMEIAIDELNTAERELFHTRHQLDAAIQARKKAAETLQMDPKPIRLDHPGDDLELASYASPDINGLADLERLAEKWGPLDAQIKQLEAEKRRLQSDDSKDQGTEFNVELLDRGSTLLLQWLQVPSEPPEDDKKAQYILIGLSAAGWLAFAISGFIFTLNIEGSLFSLVLIVGFASAALFFIVRSLLRTARSGSTGKKEVYEQDFKTLGLSQPDSWTTDYVFHRLEQLRRELLDARAEQQRLDRLKHIQIELRQAEAEVSKLEEERRQLVQKYGLPPEERVANLWWIVQRLSDFQKYDLEMHALLERLHRLEQDLAQHKDRIGMELASVGLPRAINQQGIYSIAELTAALNDVKHRRDQWVQATEKIQRAESQVDNATEILRWVASQRTALFQRLGMKDGDVEAESRVRDALKHLSSFRTAQDKLKEAQVMRQNAERQLMDHLSVGELSDVMGRPLSVWTLHEAEQRQIEAQTEAAQLSDVTARIMSIEHRIEQAKRQNKIKHALFAVDRHENDLMDLLEEESRMEIGKWLAHYLKEETRERERPQVFLRARTLFARMTQGAYRLEIDDGDPPRFRAIESETGEGKSLNQLSGGTRAQLLIAVRVAFVESQEAGVSLPIVFDESLANSDDERAEALINAVMDLAAEGRQIFYMTAQADEVAKWKEALDQRPEVPNRVINLADVRDDARWNRQPLIKVPATGKKQPPDPDDGRSYEQYGQLLKVPGVDPYIEDIGYVHLWHLLDDAVLLHRFLSARIDTWGQLKVINDSGLLHDLDEWAINGYNKAKAAARCLALITSLWRVGRGRPFDREALAESGAVSDTFMESAYDIAASYDFDAKAFIDAVDSGELKRFREDNKRQLRAFLEEQGYLDEREPYDAETLTTLVRGGILNELSSGSITGEHVERLIWSVIETS